MTDDVFIVMIKTLLLICIYICIVLPIVQTQIYNIELQKPLYNKFYYTQFVIAKPLLFFDTLYKWQGKK